MKPIQADARRYAWCHGQGLWILGMPVASFAEDMRGALEAEQYGLVRFATREIGEACAVVLATVLLNGRPIPPAAMRGSWALARLSDHELQTPCWELTRSDDHASPAELVAKATWLVGRVRACVGHLPDVLTPQGYFPALALARDWLGLVEAVGEEGFLPQEWTGRQ
jgi:hypothetical protein